jgi:hypothetical protein
MYTNQQIVDALMCYAKGSSAKAAGKAHGMSRQFVSSQAKKRHSWFKQEKDRYDKLRKEFRRVAREQGFSDSVLGDPEFLQTLAIKEHGPKSKLTSQMVKELRQLREAGKTYPQLREYLKTVYGLEVSRQAVWQRVGSA